MLQARLVTRVRRAPPGTPGPQEKLDQRGKPDPPALPARAEKRALQVQDKPVKRGRLAPRVLREQLAILVLPGQAKLDQRGKLGKPAPLDKLDLPGKPVARAIPGKRATLDQRDLLEIQVQPVRVTLDRPDLLDRRATRA